ncbi:Adaptor protein complex sigma subunit [Meredithblackwellia eburnea MCA 4105]
MIHGVLIFNSNGKARLSKFYSPSSPQARADILQRIFNLVSQRGDTLCNFVELPQGFGFPSASNDLQDAAAATQAPTHAPAGDEYEDLRVIYRHYATLYFAFIVDQSESELGILDLIQVFVESLDRCFENVCELDLIFHFDEVHVLLNCLITGGLVLDTSIDSIQQSFLAQMKARKSSQTPALSLSSLPGAEQFGLGAFKSKAR